MQVKGQGHKEHVKMRSIVPWIFEMIWNLFRKTGQIPEEKSKKSKQSEWQHRNISEGKCAQCGSEMDRSGWYCHKCAKNKRDKYHNSKQKTQNEFIN